MPIKFICAYLKSRFQSLSIIKKCSHMLRSDHRELRNSYISKVNWWEGRGGQTPNRACQVTCKYLYKYIQNSLFVKSDCMLLWILYLPISFSIVSSRNVISYKIWKYSLSNNFISTIITLCVPTRQIMLFIRNIFRNTKIYLAIFSVTT